MKPEKYVLSLSGGKDSTAMLLRLLEEKRPVDLILFCDTGLEFPQMYEHLARLEAYIGKPIIRLKAAHDFEYYFYDYTPKRKNPALSQYKGMSWPGPRNRWCTGILKTRIINAYLKELRKDYTLVEYVGIAADETKRIKENISKVIDRFQQKKADIPKKQAQKSMQRFRRSAESAKQSIKTVEHSGKTIKQTAKSTGKATVKTAKGSVKTAQKTVKTAERTARTTIKTTQQAAKTAQKTAQATAKAAKAAAQAARATAKAVATGVKAAVKATITAVKAIIAATKALIAAIAAGGWVAVVVIIIICLIGLLVGSCFGIFFSSEDSGSGQTMQQVVQEINTDYQQQIDTTKANISYDVLEMSGSRAVWPEVLAVYAVKTTTDPDNAQEVATMDDYKKAILKDIFWQMNEISSRTETKTEEVITETDDGHGNIVETKTTVSRT